MHSNKPYSNVTVTKRVDHNDHEKNTHPHEAEKEPSICQTCGAIYLDRRWTIAEIDPARIKHQPQLVTCPACKQQEEGIARGYVHLQGTFFEKHYEEIEKLLSNEADRAAQDNPLARIIKWERDGDQPLTVLTTTEHLAQRLGHAVEKAYSGEVRYDFSHENKLAHVWWQRDC